MHTLDEGVYHRLSDLSILGVYLQAVAVVVFFILALVTLTFRDFGA